MNINNILKLPKSQILEKSEYDKIVSSIPLNKIATEAMLKELKKVPNDENPMDLIFAIKYKESKNNRRYNKEAYESIVNQILTTDVFIPVCYGHQSNEEFDYKGRQIVGSVVGALLDENSGLVYYRIIPDASENNKDIRRWLRNRQINSLSIWGLAEGHMEGNIEVIDDFELRSIDLVPPLCEGQDNAGLVIGENRNNVNLNNMQNQKHGFNINKKEGGNMQPNEKNYDVKELSNYSLLGELKVRLSNGNLPKKEALSELSSVGFVSGEALAISEKEKEELKQELNALLEKAKSFGLNSIEALLKFLEETKAKEEGEMRRREFDATFAGLLEKKGLVKDGKETGEMARFVKKWSACTVGMTRDEMEANIDKVLNDAGFKKLAGESVGAPITQIEKDDGSADNKLEIYSI